MNKEQVYIIFSKRYSPGKNESIYVKDIADVYCQNAIVQNEVENIKDYTSKEEENWDYISANDVICRYKSHGSNRGNFRDKI